MSEKSLIVYIEAKRARELAEDWNNLEFKISMAHCDPPIFCRTGHSGRSETALAFNKAILETVIKYWDTIYPATIRLMKEKELLALRNTQEFINEMQQAIDDANGSDNEVV